MKPIYYMLEFHVGKFWQIYSCNNKMSDGSACNKKSTSKRCVSCPDNIYFSMETKHKLYAPEDYERKAEFIKPAYLQMLKRPKKVFRVFKGEILKYEKIREFLMKENWLGLEKTFRIDGDVNAAGREAIKGRAIVFATLDKVSPLKLEFLRQLHHSTEDFDEQEHKKDTAVNIETGYIKRDRAHAFSETYVRHFFQTQHKYD